MARLQRNEAISTRPLGRRHELAKGRYLHGEQSGGLSGDVVERNSLTDAELLDMIASEDPSGDPPSPQ